MALFTASTRARYRRVADSAASAVAVGAGMPARPVTSDYIQHDANDSNVVVANVTSSSPATDKADATWIAQPGLADSSCLSFESANVSGSYLRHSGFQLYLDADDGTSQFAPDATFCPRPGHNGQGYSFQSVNYPLKFIRHYDYIREPRDGPVHRRDGPDVERCRRGAVGQQQQHQPAMPGGGHTFTRRR